MQQTDIERDLFKTKLGIKKNVPVVGIVANLNRPVKRVDLFIHAAAKVLRQISNVQFIIVGDGYLRYSLEQYAKKRGIYRSIHFVGSVNNPNTYIGIFDVAVLTSDSEGFSNSIIEYMAHGIPIVASEIGGNVEIIKCNLNGLLFQTGDTSQLFEHLVTLLENQKMRIKMGNNAKNMCSAFFWDTNILNYQTFYNTLTF